MPLIQDERECSCYRSRVDKTAMPPKRDGVLILSQHHVRAIFLSGIRGTGGDV